MIDINKKYRTRDGHEVRIYATDGISPSPVHGAFLTIDGWATCNWTKTGEKFLVGESFIDLIEVKPRIQRTAWVNVFPNATTMFLHRLDADTYAGFARLACVKVEIDCEEGEGL